ncbi:MAG: HD domain-containing protein [Candidatus Woesearchaeota archaeon]
MKSEKYRRTLEELDTLAQEMMPKLPYHNYEHAVEVYNAAKTYAQIGNLPEKETFLLKAAAKMHDIIFVPGAKDNEERSANFATNYLKNNGYDKTYTQAIKGMILATKYPQSPRNHLEELLCDADLDHLGTDAFFDKGEMLRKEYGIEDNSKWIYTQISFLEDHKYHTDIANKLRQEKKQGNLANLKRMREMMK